MKTNVGKSGVLHLSKKRARRTVDRFYIYIGGKEKGVVEEYQYLKNVVHEYLTNVRMIYRAERKVRSEGTD